MTCRANTVLHHHPDGTHQAHCRHCGARSDVVRVEKKAREWMAMHARSQT
jgi:hypothetical protein